MRRKKEKILLPLIFSIFLFLPVIVGCSVLDSLTGKATKLANTDEQKQFAKAAEEEFGKQTEYKIAGTIKAKNDSEMTILMEMKGDDYEMQMTSSEQDMGVVSLGTFEYLGVSGKWVKMKKEDSSDYTQSFEGLKDDFDNDFLDDKDQDWEKENIKYEGLEEIDGTQCHKFYNKDKNGNVGYVWIGAKDKLLRKIQMTEGDSTGTITVSYKNIEINPPEQFDDLTSLSQEEQANKILELFGGL